jgi:hypothetical protein
MQAREGNPSKRISHDSQTRPPRYSYNPSSHSNNVGVASSPVVRSAAQTAVIRTSHLDAERPSRRPEACGCSATRRTRGKWWSGTGPHVLSALRVIVPYMPLTTRDRLPQSASVRQQPGPTSRDFRTALGDILPVTPDTNFDSHEM